MAAKKKTFNVVKAVKDAARDNVGTPKPTRTIPHDKDKAEKRTGKHKKPLAELIDEDL